jgi:hypothetical protein
MKVAELLKVIDGIANGLSDVAKKAADGLTALRAGLQPFQEQSVGDFVAFLSRCEEYNRTGLVTSGKRGAAPRKAAGTPPPSVDEAVGSVRGILGQINAGGVTGRLIDEAVAGFQKMTKVQLVEVLKGLDIQGKPKTKDDALARIKQVLDTQFEMYVRTHPAAHQSGDGAPAPGRTL